MAQKKAHEVDRWIAQPENPERLILVYGPDRGLVSERARRIALKTGLSLDDPFAVIRLDAGELDQDPGRLVDEARTVAMFGGQRLIWVTGAGAQKGLANAVKELADRPSADALILIEGGDLKKGAGGLRGIVETARSAMALPCYADKSRDIDQLIDDEMTRARISITPEARQLLKASLGGDRLASRGEIEKLLLYAQGQDRIGVEDIMASVGDASAISADDAVDAMLNGAWGGFDAAFSTVLDAGAHPFVVLSAALRQFAVLQRLRAEMDQTGRGAAAVVASARPPVFFARKQLVEAALDAWQGEAIARALDRLQATVLETRRRPDLAAALTRQALLALAVESARARRRR
ncbi:MAG: DNA polymerase III subunit delta [Notoacmeibacter sp.]|nr:DNA polymerase III subunit delta [Notoacmeibacter sp.]